MRFSRRNKLGRLVIASATVALPMIAHATTATWTGGGTDTNWDTGGNWNPSEPNAVDDVAIFNTSGATATADVGVTLGVFDLNANTTINGTSTLTLESNDLNSPGILPAVNLTGAGTVGTISAPIQFVPNINVIGTPRLVFNGISGASGTTLNINGGLSSSGVAGATDFQSGTFTQGSGAGAAFNIGAAQGMFVGDDGGTAVLNVNSNVTDATVLILGEQQSATSTPGIGTINQSAGVMSTSGTVRIGQGFIAGSASYTPGVTAGSGTYNLSGGSMSTASGIAIVVGSQGGTGALNVSAASTTVMTGGQLNLASTAGAAPGMGGSGSATITDGTITVGNTGTGTATAIGSVNPTAASTLLINGSTATSGGRFIVSTGALSLSNQTVGTTTSITGATGASSSMTIQNGGTAMIGGQLTVGSSIPSVGYLSLNTATVSISGTTPAAFGSKLSIGTTLGIGTSGGVGVFQANESDTKPILVGSATSAGLITIGSSGFFTNNAGSTYNGGNGSMLLSGQTVLNLNSSTTAAITGMTVGSSALNTVAVGSNLGSTGVLTLSGSAALNVNSLANANAISVVIGSGASDALSAAGSGTVSLSNSAQLNLMKAGSLTVASNECNGTLNVSDSAQVLVAGGTINDQTSAGQAPNTGGVGSITVTDGTITDNNSGTGTALSIGGVNSMGQSSLTIKGSTATSGGRVVITNGSVTLGAQNVSTSTIATQYTNSVGATGAVSIQNGGTMLIGAALTIGSGLPSPSYASVNSGTFSVSGTTPGALASKLSVGTSLSIGIGGGTGSLSINESDTTPVVVGGASVASSVLIGTSGTVTNTAAVGLPNNTAIGGGNGSMSLSGQAVFVLNSNAAAGGNIMAIGSSSANTVTPGTNVGSIGSVSLHDNAVLNVNTTSPNALNITVGNGVANAQGSAGSGTLSLADSSALNLNSGNLLVGLNETPGVLTVGNSAHLTMTGATASLVVGSHANATTGSPDFSTTSFSSLNLSGTSSLVTTPAVLVGIGVNGAATVSGGTLDATSGGITLGSSVGAGGAAGTIGNGSLTVTGGVVETGGAGNLVLSANNTSTASEKGTLNLQGGLVQIGGSLLANGAAANSLVNFTGGELQAATINPANFTSSVSQAALPGALQQMSNALVQSNTSGSSSLHAANGNLTISGGYVLLGGTAQADGTNTTTVSGLTSVNNGTIQGSGTFSTDPTNGFGINGTLTAAGPGVVNLNGPSANQPGATLAVTGGTVNVSSASTTPATVTVGSAGIMNLNGTMPTGANLVANGTVNLAMNLGTSVGTVTLGSLSVGASGQVNLANNHMFIDYGGGPDPVSSVAGWLASGYAAGTWTGPGINSTAAAANSLSYGLGYADSADAGNPAGLSSGTIEVAYTLLGDANLDYAVNGVDFGILAANFNKGITGWDKGDFNYDNAVNGVDFGVLAANFNKGASGVAGASAADWAALDAFAAANGLLADVPEPASVGVAVLGVAGVLARRRRSRGR
jgi:hypothetical protein